MGVHSSLYTAEKIRSMVELCGPGPKANSVSFIFKITKKKNFIGEIVLEVQEPVISTETEKVFNGIMKKN